MTNKDSHFDLSDDLVFHVFRNGIRLLPQDSRDAMVGKRLSDVMKLPISVYFLSNDASTVKMNAEAARICGFESPEEAIGKTLLSVSKKEAATKLIDNCHHVMASAGTQVFEETNLRQDNSTQLFLSFKTPWYNENDEIIGICGFSIVLGTHPLAESLASLSELGLLRPNKPTAGVLCGVQLTQRETECLRQAMQGFSAKQIARELKISHRTVEEYLSNIRIKTGAQSKAQLLEWATAQGF